MTNICDRIIAAMTTCGMKAIGEGDLYYSLFRVGISSEEATTAIRALLADGTLHRSGCAFILRSYVGAHGDESSNREGAVRIS